MKTFEDWKNGKFLGSMERMFAEDAWNAAQSNSAEEITKLVQAIADHVTVRGEQAERIKELTDTLTSHGPEGHNWANAQVVAIREIMHAQAGRIKELESFQEWLNNHCIEGGDKCDELAAQNQAFREVLNLAVTTPFMGQDAFTLKVQDAAIAALSLPDLASPVLNRMKAEVLREAKNEVAKGSDQYIDNPDTYLKGIGRGLTFSMKVLERKADDIEKGEGNATD